MCVIFAINALLNLQLSCADQNTGTSSLCNAYPTTWYCKAENNVNCILHNDPCLINDKTKYWERYDKHIFETQIQASTMFSTLLFQMLVPPENIENNKIHPRSVKTFKNQLGEKRVRKCVIRINKKEANSNHLPIIEFHIRYKHNTLVLCGHLFATVNVCFAKMSILMSRAEYLENIIFGIKYDIRNRLVYLCLIDTKEISNAVDCLMHVRLLESLVQPDNLNKQFSYEISNCHSFYLKSIFHIDTPDSDGDDGDGPVRNKRNVPFSSHGTHYFDIDPRQIKHETVLLYLQTENRMMEEEVNHLQHNFQPLNQKTCTNVFGKNQYCTLPSARKCSSHLRATACMHKSNNSFTWYHINNNAGNAILNLNRQSKATNITIVLEGHLGEVVFVTCDGETVAFNVNPEIVEEHFSFSVTQSNSKSHILLHSFHPNPIISLSLLFRDESVNGSKRISTKAYLSNERVITLITSKLNITSCLRKINISGFRNIRKIQLRLSSGLHPNYEMTTPNSLSKRHIRRTKEHNAMNEPEIIIDHQHNLKVYLIIIVYAVITICITGFASHCYYSTRKYERQKNNPISMPANDTSHSEGGSSCPTQNVNLHQEEQENNLAVLVDDMQGSLNTN